MGGSNVVTGAARADVGRSIETAIADKLSEAAGDESAVETVRKVKYGEHFTKTGRGKASKKTNSGKNSEQESGTQGQNPEMSVASHIPNPKTTEDSVNEKLDKYLLNTNHPPTGTVKLSGLKKHWGLQRIMLRNLLSKSFLIKKPLSKPKQLFMGKNIIKLFR